MSFDPGSVISLIENCKKLYNYAADVKHSSDERSRLLDEVHSLEGELTALHGLATTPAIADDPASMERLAQLLDPTEPFAKAVDKTLGRIKHVLPKASRFKVFRKPWAAALWWTVDKAEVKDLLSDLERYKSRIRLALQLDIYKKQDVMDRKLDFGDRKQDTMDRKLVVIDGKQDAVAKQLSDENRLKIAQFISQNECSGHRVDLSEKRLAGTGTWMLQHPEFVAWRDNEQSPTTLWCYGHPGAGKSIMAALIVDHLQSTPGNIVLSVFCRYSSDNFTTPFPVLRGLLRQLIERSSKVPATICERYWKGIPPTPDDLPGFLVEAATVHTRPIYIVIDALDECKIALDLLCAIEQLGPLFRVLITSRPVFTEIKEYSSIKIRASEHDILVAVNATLPKLKGAWLDDALKNMIRAKIVEKADGMFLLASLQLRELERDVICQRDVVAILGSLPRTLDDAYKLTFQRIFEQGERKLELACRALAVVSLHSRYLGIERTQHLLAEGDATQYTDTKTILQCCHGLVCRGTAPDDIEILEFIHYSVHEYTGSHWSELFPKNPNQSAVCLRLGYSVLIHPIARNYDCWEWIVFAMREPEELEQVISLLSTPAARAALVEYYPELAPFVHDPLLIACNQWYGKVMEYMIRTAAPDVQRFNEALRICRNHWYKKPCIEHINARSDMRVNSDGVVVAVDPDGGEGN